MLIILILICSTISLAKDFQERTEWGHFFTDQNVQGTIVIVDERSGSHWVYNKARAQTRYSPASTFKVPHPYLPLMLVFLKMNFRFFHGRVKRDIMNPGTGIITFDL